MNKSAFHPVIITDNAALNKLPLAATDCACPTWKPAKDIGHWMKSPLPETPICHATVYKSQITNDIHAFLPTLSCPGMVLLNRDALRLWCAFEHPSTLVEVQLSFPTVSRTLIGNAVHRMLELGLLSSDSYQMSTSYESDTMSVWLHITNACNLDCTYCYVNKNSQPMNHTVSKRAIDGIFRSALLHKYPKVEIKYAGGEPLLNFTQVIGSYDYASRIAKETNVLLHAIVLSNGTALTSRRITEMVERSIELMISLDGVREIHNTQRRFLNGTGSFNAVQDGIEKAVNMGLIPSISVTVTERNALSLKETVQWLLDRNLPFSLNFFRTNDKAVKHNDLHKDETLIIEGMLGALDVIEGNLPQQTFLGTLVDRVNFGIPHTRTCGVERNYFVISHDGNVAKCQMLMDSPVASVEVEDPLGIVQRTDGQPISLSVDDKAECRSCQWKYWCTGGCPVETFRVKGRYDVKSPNCRIYKALFPEIIRLEAKRILKYSAPSIDSEPSGAALGYVEKNKLTDEIDLEC